MPITKTADSTLKKMFIVDGLGALLSAFLLGVVLVYFESYFGIPKSSLYILAALPCFFAAYDLFCYLKVDKNLGRFLKGIAIANLLYCCLSIGFAIFHRSVITSMGWAYIVVEIIVVVMISKFELELAERSQ